MKKPDFSMTSMALQIKAICTRINSELLEIGGIEIFCSLWMHYCLFPCNFPGTEQALKWEKTITCTKL